MGDRRAPRPRGRRDSARGLRTTPSRGTRTIEAYRAWAARTGSQVAALEGEPSWSPQRRFDRAFERLALPGLGRTGRYEFLSVLGATGVVDMEASSLQLGQAGDPTVLAAKRVFGIGDTINLQRRAAELAGATGVPIAALDLAPGQLGPARGRSDHGRNAGGPRRRRAPARRSRRRTRGVSGFRVERVELRVGDVGRALRSSTERGGNAHRRRRAVRGRRARAGRALQRGRHCRRPGPARRDGPLPHRAAVLRARGAGGRVAARRGGRPATHRRVRPRRLGGAVSRRPRRQRRRAVLGPAARPVARADRARRAASGCSRSPWT